MVFKGIYGGPCNSNENNIYASLAVGTVVTFVDATGRNDIRSILDVSLANLCASTWMVRVT